MASRGRAERLPGAPFFFLCLWFVLSSPFICLFIHSFISSVFIRLFCHSVTPMVPKVGLEGRWSFLRKKDFPPTHTFCLFHFLPRIPVSSFYSLRSFVIFGSVRHFGVSGEQGGGAVEDFEETRERRMFGCRRLMKGN